MKFLLLLLLLAAIAGVEVYHVLSSADARDAVACMAPDGQTATIRDVLLSHFHNH